MPADASNELEGKIEQLMLMRTQCDALDSQVQEYIQSRLRVRDEFIDIVEAVLEAIHEFPDAQAVLAVLTSLPSKPPKTGGGKKKHKHDKHDKRQQTNQAEDDTKWVMIAFVAATCVLPSPAQQAWMI